MPVKPWPEKSERRYSPDDGRNSDVEKARPMHANARYEARAGGDTVTENEEARSRRMGGVASSGECRRYSG
jgi:hypothetical protein